MWQKTEFYKEKEKFYQSKEWRQVRKTILMRDNFMCVMCGKPAVDVHHKKRLTPKNLYKTEINMNPDNLISLCKECHTATHRKHRQIFDENGYLVST